MLTVSMPYYRTAGSVTRAVRSVLRQTHRDFTLVVVNDGDDPDTAWEPLTGIDDPRLIRYDLPPSPNGHPHGRYFVDAVVAHAARTEWFTCHDSDDWSHQNRYDGMLRIAAGGGDVIPGGETIRSVTRGRAVRYRRPLTRIGRTSGPIPHMWHISALYRTELFRRAIHPAFYVAWDSLMSAMLATAEDVHVRPCNHVHYHRIGREGSLTRHPDTGIGSDYRQRVVAVLTDLWDRYQQLGPSLAAIDKILDGSRDVAMPIVEAHAAELRPLLPQ